MSNLYLRDTEVILFDWDNTLADTREIVVNSINKVLKEYNMPEWDEVKKLRDKNLSFQDNFANIFEDKCLEAYKKYSEYYKKNADLVSNIKGAYRLINLLKVSQKKIAVITNKDRELFELECSHLYSKDLFDNIVCGHEAEKNKPNPEHAFKALDGLIDIKNIGPETVWLIGDTSQDVECALNTGIQPILIGNPIWSDEVMGHENIAYFPDFDTLYSDITSER